LASSPPVASCYTGVTRGMAFHLEDARSIAGSLEDVLTTRELAEFLRLIVQLDAFVALLEESPEGLERYSIPLRIHPRIPGRSP
jgi:hypothetical protein